MSAHTAGPWRVSDGSRVIWSNDSRVVAEIRGMFIQPMKPETYSQAETDANARLIAAAPDLLAALKALRASEELIDDAYYDAYAEASVMAVAAIAKAEGQP